MQRILNLLKLFHYSVNFHNSKNLHEWAVTTANNDCVLKGKSLLVWGFILLINLTWLSSRIEHSQLTMRKSSSLVHCIRESCSNLLLSMHKECLNLTWWFLRHWSIKMELKRRFHANLFAICWVWDPNSHFLSVTWNAIKEGKKWLLFKVEATFWEMLAEWSCESSLRTKIYDITLSWSSAIAVGDERFVRRAENTLNCAENEIILICLRWLSRLEWNKLQESWNELIWIYMERDIVDFTVERPSPELMRRKIQFNSSFVILEKFENLKIWNRWIYESSQLSTLKHGMNKILNTKNIKHRQITIICTMNHKICLFKFKKQKITKENIENCTIIAHVFLPTRMPTNNASEPPTTRGAYDDVFRPTKTTRNSRKCVHLH